MNWVQRFEMVKLTAGMSASIRHLESWESAEATSVFEMLKTTSEAFESLAWQELKAWVQSLEDGIAEGKLNAEEFIPARDKIADGLDLMVGACLLEEVKSRLEEASKQRNWEINKTYALEIETISDLVPASIARTKPKRFNRYKQMMLKVKTDLEAVDEEHVLDVFRPDDEAVYRWRISSQAQWNIKLVVILSYAFFVGVIAVGLPLGIFLLIGLASEVVAFWFAVLVSIVTLVIYLLGSVALLMPEKLPSAESQRQKLDVPKKRRLSERLKARSRRHMAASRQHMAAGRRNMVEARRKSSKLGVIFWASVSIGAMFYAISSPVQIMREGFGGEVDSFTQWILFYVDSAIRVISLDIPGSVGWNFSAITTVSGYSKIATVFLQLTITASIVNLAINLWMSLFREGIDFGTADGLFWKQRFFLAKSSRTSIERVAKEAQYEPPDKVRLSDFVSAFDKHHKKPIENYAPLEQKGLASKEEEG